MFHREGYKIISTPFDYCHFNLLNILKSLDTKTIQLTGNYILLISVFRNQKKNYY